jgi:hypothetical protein
MVLIPVFHDFMYNKHMNPQCLLVRSAQQKEDASYEFMKRCYEWVAQLIATGIAEYLIE